MPKPSTKHSLLRILFLRLCTFVGGAMFGMGLLVLAQLQVIWAIKDEVRSAGFLGRALGRLTFPWRSFDEKIAFGVDALPTEWLHHTKNSGYCLLVGGVVVGYLLPFAIRLWWWSKRRPKQRV